MRVSLIAIVNARERVRRCPFLAQGIDRAPTLLGREFVGLRNDYRILDAHDGLISASLFLS
jgi:hypothetical protein